MINKLILPTDGTIYVNGKDISKENEIELRRNIGYVIQQTGLFPHMTVRENIELIPKIKNKRNNGKDISKENEIELRRNIGYVIQQTGLFPHMTVRENIELIPKIKNKRNKEKEGKKEEA